MSYTNDPVKDAENYYSRKDNRPIIGICESCGFQIHGRTAYEHGDDYVEISDGLVHWECWDAYGQSFRKEG